MILVKDMMTRETAAEKMNFFPKMTAKSTSFPPLKFLMKNMAARRKGKLHYRWLWTTLTLGASFRSTWRLEARGEQ
jgi:hypothetical protein